MTGFEPGSSDIGSDRSANCATTTARHPSYLPRFRLGFLSNIYLFDDGSDEKEDEQ